jgi:flagellar hook-basal body complex protein FliE
MAKEYNRGNLAEPILAAAIVAKFIDRPTKDNKQKTPWVVTDKELKDVLKKMFKKVKVQPAKSKTSKPQMVGEVKLERKDILESVKKSKKAFQGISGKFWIEETPTIIDEVSFKASIPRPDMDWLANSLQSAKANLMEIQDIFDSSRKYVNEHPRLNKLAKKLATNSRVDKFHVGAVGTEDQTGTKVDIKMEHNGKKISTQISLKVSGGEQFAQVAGVTFEKQQTLWHKNLRLPKKSIDALKAEWDKVMDKYNDPKKFPKEGYSSRANPKINIQTELLKEAVMSVYVKATELLNIEFKKDKRRTRNKYIETMIEFIGTQAAGDEKKYVELVKLVTGGTYKRLTFQKEFIDKISQLQLKATIDKNRVATVKIEDTVSKLPLIQIRLLAQQQSGTRKGKKMYSVYGRNIVEAPTNSILYTIIK